MSRKKLLILIFGLFLFHMTLSGLFYFISIKGYFPSLNNGKGIWNYACDSNAYHEEAVKGLEILNDQGIGAWWKYSYHGWWHVRWISLMYKIFKPVPIAMAPLNAMAWVLCFFLAFYISRDLVSNERMSFAAAFIFSFVPSNLMTSIQLLKDPFYILGVLIFILGWIWVWKRCNGSGGIYRSRALLFPVLCVGAGFYLLGKIRFYLVTVWFGVAIVFYLFTLVRHPKQWILSTMMIGVILILFFSSKPGILKLIPTTPKYPWKYSAWVPDILENQLIKLAQFRKAFAMGCPNAGSNIDTRIGFHSVGDILHYLPRAIEIGLLAPFPGFWLGKAKTTGKIARILVCGEMILLYLLYFGVFFLVLKKELSYEVSILTVSTFCFILLLALVVANLGTLHRMRHVYLLPIFILGVGGWGSLLGQNGKIEK